MIKNTNTNCRIKDIKVTGSIAYITLILHATLPTQEARVFKFYLYDKDTDEPMLASNNNYWVDNNNNYNNDSLNIDVNMYKEVILQVDITKGNKGLMQENKWIRYCRLVLVDVTKVTTINAWYSDDLVLVSKEIDLPIVKGVSIISERDYSLKLNFYYSYKSHSDFNYNNKNLYTTVNIKSPYTYEVIETIDILEEDSLTSKVSVTFLNTYTEYIMVEILLKNLLGETLYRYETLYKPVVKYSNTFIKTNKGVKRAVSFNVLDEDLDRVINFNNAKVKQLTIDTLISEVKATVIASNKIRITQPEYHNRLVTTQLLFNGELIAVLTGEENIVETTSFAPLFMLQFILSASSNIFSTQVDFQKEYSYTRVSNDSVCSTEYYCTEEEPV